MPKKLAITAICAALLLSGCGSAAGENAPMAMSDSNESVHYSTTEGPAEAQGIPYGAAASVDGASGVSEAAPEEKALDTASEVSYFTFSRYEQNISDETGQTLLYERSCSPSFYSADGELSQWINDVLDVINGEFRSNSENLLDYAGEYLELNGAESFYSYSNYQELGIARHDESVVSLISLSSLYSGGAHPNAVQTAYNLDIENRRLLMLEDVIEETGAPELAQMVVAGVQEKFEPLGEYALYENYTDTIEQSLQYGAMTPYWYFNDNGLVVFFNQYELGPYAAGIIKVELSYNELEGILVEDYLPEYGGAAGTLRLDSGAGDRRIPITIESDGESLTIGVEGRVFQIQLSEVYWLEQTPIMQEILFSAASMAEGDLLEVIGGYTDDGRSFAIEYINGSGERKIIYLHTDGLSEEP